MAKSNTTNYQGSSPEQRTGDTGSSGGVVSSIEEALRVLDRAIVENKDELTQRLSSDFQDLKSALSGLGPQVKDTLTQYSSQAVSMAQDMGRQGYDKTREMATDVATQVDTSVRANPWTYIGGAAVGSLLLGYMMGRSGRSELGYE